MKQCTDNRDNSTLNRSLGKALTVLRTYLHDGGELGIRDVARRLGFSPAAVYRTVSTLVQHEFLEQNIENRRYRVSVRHVAEFDSRIESATGEELTPSARDGREQSVILIN